MFDLLPDGKIAIDFQPADGPPVRVVVNPPPTVGAVKRLRRKANEIDDAARAYALSLDEEPPEPAEGEEPAPTLTAAEKRNLVIERNDDTVLAWWTFTLLGDDTWKGLAPDVPADTDEWPVYMATVDSLTLAQQHWRQTPLARGGKLVAETS